MFEKRGKRVSLDRVILPGCFGIIIVIIFPRTSGSRRAVGSGNGCIGNTAIRNIHPSFTFFGFFIVAVGLGIVHLVAKLIKEKERENSG